MSELEKEQKRTGEMFLKMSSRSPYDLNPLVALSKEQRAAFERNAMLLSIMRMQDNVNLVTEYLKTEAARKKGPIYEFHFEEGK